MIEPGFALPAATRSWTVLKRDGGTTSTLGYCAERNDRREIAHRVVGQLGVGRRRDGVHRRVDEQRVAVRLRLRDRRHAERAAGTGPGLVDDGLADLARHVVEHRARHRVDRAARRERRDQADGLPGRPCWEPGPGRCPRARPRRAARKPRARIGVASSISSLDPWSLARGGRIMRRASSACKRRK